MLRFVEHSSSLFDHQHRTGSLTDDSLRYRAHEKFFYPGSAVATHDDYIHLISKGILDDGVIGLNSLGHQTLDWHPLLVGGAYEPMHDFFGLNYFSLPPGYGNSIQFSLRFPGKRHTGLIV